MEISEYIKVPKEFSKYKTLSVLSKSQNSVVVKAMNTKTNEIVAAKIVSRKSFQNVTKLRWFEREIRLLQMCDHPNITKILDIVYFPDIIIVVMTYASNGELLSYLAKNKFLPQIELFRILGQILSAISYLHKKNIAHRDIKPENILFDEHMNVKIIDFGFSVISNQLRSTICGSEHYIAPEVIIRDSYDAKAADIWSIGILTYVMATGSHPFKKLTDLHDLFNDGRFILTKKLPPEIENVIRKTLILKPELRATADELDRDVAMFQLPNKLGMIKRNVHSVIVHNGMNSIKDHHIMIRRKRPIAKSQFRYGPFTHPYN